MFYDYIITQFYPNIPFLVCINLVVIVLALVFYFAGMPDKERWTPKEARPDYIKKWKWKLYAVLISQTLMLCFYFWIPDVNYVKYFYGDVRVTTLTPEQIAKQKAELQADYDRHYERSKQLLLDCLDKGQKQPHTTTFNDTNEVIKTCYDVAKYKF
ncbi:hypothetical protein ACKERC_02760 [Acinetobacter baumannii]|uniref:hypothetical protein n=1 Tax=Acinetobacter baumannii TaxID=470 RepID=UPI0038B466E2